MFRVSTSLAAILFACAATTAIGGGANTPITSERQALRAVLTAVDLQRTLSDDFLPNFAIGPRQIVDLGLRALAARTTLSALSAAADGISVPCPVSGTLSARVIAGWVRVVKLSWESCVLEDTPGSKRSIDGPAEVILLGDSLAPRLVASIRLGSPERDLLQVNRRPLSRTSSGDFLRWNIRETGVIPMAREQASGPFPGRYFMEVTGFQEFTQPGRDVPDFGPPFYSRVWTYSAERLVMTGESTQLGDAFTDERRILAGTFTEKLDSEARPNRPYPVNISSTFRAHDLLIRNGFDNASGKPFFKIDGTVDADLTKFIGIPGCTASEIFTYKTRQPITGGIDEYFIPLFDGGELSVNGAATAGFSITGVERLVDRTMHVGIDVARVGNFQFDEQDWLYNLASQAGCGP